MGWASSCAQQPVGDDNSASAYRGPFFGGYRPFTTGGRPHVSKRELDVVEVTCDGKTDVIAFNPQYAQAPIAIDIEGIRNSAVFDRQQLTEIARHL